jgi:hypothetical protein
MPFPSPATNGQTYEAGGFVYTYNAARKTWVKTGYASAVVVGNVTIAPNTSTISIGNVNISANGIVAGNTVITSNAITVGNTSITANAITVGNTSITANAVTVGNTSITANAVTVGNTRITSNAITVGNTSITSNAITTGNTTITSGGITTGNTAVTPQGITVGNTSVTANGITAGNVTISNNGISVGNASISSNGSAVFTTITSGQFTGNIFSSNVIENTNLFFTNARVLANVSAISIKGLADVDWQSDNAQASKFLTTGRYLRFDGDNWVPDTIDASSAAFAENANNAIQAQSADSANVSNFVLSLNNLTTSNLAEGTNLYFTNARVISLLTNLPNTITATAFVGDGSRLTNISAGAIANSVTQLFQNTANFSQNVVVNTAVITSAIFANIWNNLYTSNIIENGSTTTGNVFFTNARARGALTAGQNINYDRSTGIISVANSLVIDRLTAREGVFSGNLTVLGNLITISSNSTTVSDSLFYLANGNTLNDVIDIGFIGTYKDGGGVQRQTGFFRDATDKTYKLYQNGIYQTGSVINVDDGGFRFANLTIDTLFGAVDWANITNKPDPVITVSLDGDVIGNASTTLRDLASNSITISTIIKPNSVELGVDTFGQYVGNLLAGNGIVITNSGGENSTPTISVANIDTILINTITNLGSRLDLTTSNIIEGTNLYYTNARVLSNVSQMSVNVLLDVDLSGVTTGNTLVWDGTKFIPGTAGIAAGQAVGIANVATLANVATIANAVVSLSNFSTSNLREGSNLYFTNARVIAAVDNSVLGNVYIANLTAGNLAYAGNLTVGNIVSAHGYIQLDNDTRNTIIQSGIWSYRFDDDGNFYVPNIIVTGAIFGNITGNISVGTLSQEQVQDFAAPLLVNGSHSGITFTYDDENNRINATVTGSGGGGGTSGSANVSNFSNASGIANVAYFANAAGFANTTSFANAAGFANTTNFANVAGTANTAGFANTAGIANVVVSISNFSTSNLREGSNLYFTNARVFSNVSQLSISTLADVDTTGSVHGYVLAWNGTNWTGIDPNIIIPNADHRNLSSDLRPSVPDTYDLGNTSNFWRTVYAAEVRSISYKNFDGNVFVPNLSKLANTANTANVVLSLSNFTTSNLTEGNNLYFTNARVIAAVSQANITNIRITGDIIAANVRVSGNINVAGNIVLGAAGTITGTVGDNTTTIVSGIYQSRFTDDGYVNVPNVSAYTVTVANVLGVNGLVNLSTSTRILGNILPIADGTYNLGSPTNRFKGLYIGGQTIDIGGGLFKFEDGKFKLQNADGSPAKTEIYTGNIIEQGDTTTGNLFFTNTRARSAFANSTGVLYDVSTGVFSIGQPVFTYSDVTFKDVTVDGTLYSNDITASNVTVYGDAIVTGNLTVQGNVTTLNTETLVVEDKNIVLANGSPSAAASDGAGITIEGAGATLQYAASGDKWVFNKDLDVTSNVTATRIIATQWQGIYTANVIEDTNLYYTNDRVYSNVSLMSINTLADVDTTGIQTNYYLKWNGTNWVPSLVSATADTANLSLLSDFANLAAIANVAYFANLSGTANIVLSLDNLSTSNLIEGANLYFTNARSRASLSAGDETIIYDPVTGTIRANVAANVVSINGQQGFISLDTDDIPEGTANLYYTNTRVFANISPLLTTANIREVNNLYYTNARVQQYVSNVSLPNITVTGNVRAGNIVLGTATLTNTNDNNTIIVANAFTYTFADTGIATFPGNIIGRTFFGNITSLFGLSTSNLAEGSNLYYTNARVYSNVIPLLNLKANVADLTTSNVIEGSNLYFTNARARAALSGGTGVVYDSSTGTINIGQNVATTSSVVFKDLTLTGNLSVGGTSTVINARSVAISDNMIYLNEALEHDIVNAVGNGTSVTYTVVDTVLNAIIGEVVRITGVNPVSFNQASYVPITGVSGNTFTISSAVTDTYISGGNAFIKSSINPDLGWSGGYSDGTYAHAGMFRDATDGTFKVFEGYTPEPDANIFIDTSHASFRFANLTVNRLYGTVDYANIANKPTTSNIAEGSNLYYTNARVISGVTQANITNLTVSGNIVSGNVIGKFFGDGSGLTGIVASTSIIGLTTSNVAEGSNLYYTNARVLSNVAQMSINVLADVDTTGIQNGYVLKWNGSQWVPAVDATTAGTSGSAETANIANLVLSLSNLTTSNLAEGGNLYFTNARVISAVANTSLPNLTVAGNLRVNGNIVLGSASFGVSADNNTTIRAGIWNYTFGDSGLATFPNLTIQSNLNLGNSSISGNFDNNTLIIAGTSTYRFGDTGNLTLPGNIVFPGSTAIIGTNDNNTIITAGVFQSRFGDDGNVTLANLVVSGFLYGNGSRLTGLVSTISLTGLSTSNLAEGNSLYYTNARVLSAVASANVTNITVTANIVAGNIIGTHFGNGQGLTGLTTGIVAEGTSNLYYTNARVLAGVAGANVSNITVSGNIVAGNIIATGFLYGNGALLTGIAAGLSGLSTYGGNILASNIVVTGNLTIGGNLRFGSTSFGTSADNNTTIRAGIWNYVFGDSGTATFPNLTVQSNLNLGNSSISGNFDNNTLVIAGTSTYRFGDTGNLTLPGNIIFPGSTSIISTGDNNTIITAGVFQSRFADDGNVTLANVVVPSGGFYYGNGSRLTGITTTVTLTGLSTSTLAEGTNLYYTNARVWSNIYPLLTTANIAEITNLYYTNARVIAGVATANIANLTLTANLVAGNVVSRFFGNGQGLTGITTGIVSEGSANLYFTNARVLSAVATANISNLTVTGNINASNVVATFFVGNGALLSGISTATNLSGLATYGGNILASNIVVTGNLTVSGNINVGNTRITTTPDNNTIITAGAYSYTFADTGVATFPGLSVGNATVTSTLSVTSDNNTEIRAGIWSYKFTDTGDAILPNVRITTALNSNTGSALLTLGNDGNTRITAGAFTSIFQDTGNVLLPNIVVSGKIYGDGSALTGVSSSGGGAINETLVRARAIMYSILMR